MASWKAFIFTAWVVGLSPYALAQHSSSLLLKDVGIWESSSGTIRRHVSILISDGVIVESSSQDPVLPPGTPTIAASGLFVLGNVTPGARANLVGIDVDPTLNISVLADSVSHTRLVIKDGTLLKNELAATEETDHGEDPFHVPLRPIALANDSGSIGFAGIIMMDSLGVRQDVQGQQQVGEIDNTGAGVSGVRFGVFGHLGRDYRVRYYTDIGYNGFAEGFDIQNDDEYSVYNLEFTFPETRMGTISVGRMKPPGTISRMWAGAYMPLPARQAPVSALTKSRDDAVMLSNTALEDRMTWSVSVSNDWLSEDTGSMSDASTYLTGRLTGQLLSDETHERLLHVGATARFSDFANESIRFRSKPGVPFVPDFLDTGKMPGERARWLTGEFAYRKDRLMISGEYIRTDLDSPTIGDPTFSGSYLWAEWSLTGEVRNYDAEKGLFTRPIPAHDFGRGGAGYWSLALGANDTNLNDGAIEGGDMQQLTFGINWYPQKSYRWGLVLSRVWLDRHGLESQTDFAHLFFHLSNL